jgi:glycosyltransferase involved in cell wall biosynthesis
MTPTTIENPTTTVHEPFFWLSILVPVYQVQAYLQACADAILEQADGGVEVIFLDDASPDDCATLLARLKAAHPAQVRVLKHERNQGLSAARNTLLNAARGKYIWFIDSDDLLEKNTLSRLKSIVQKTSVDLVMCDFRRFEDNPESAQRSRQEHIASFKGPYNCLSKDQDLLVNGLFKTGQFHVWSKIIRKACWPVGQTFPVGQNFEDLAIIPKLLVHIKTYYHEPKVWIAYRQHTGTILSALSSARIKDWTEALVGYPIYLRQQAPCLGYSAHFEVAHFCARTFIRAAKKQTQLNQIPQREWLPQFAARWALSSPLSFADLMRSYVKRGYWLRALQFFYWMQRSRRS